MMLRSPTCAGGALRRFCRLGHLSLLLLACLPLLAQAAGEKEMLLWLNRLGYGPTTANVERYRVLGQTRYVREQLQGGDDRQLPPEAAAAIASLSISRRPLETLAQEVDEENRRINKELPEGETKQEARRQLNDKLQRVALETSYRHLWRALYSPQQLQEQLVWFWFNHFNVHQQKAQVRWLLADYEERAIRPYVFGKFRDLLAATLQHPAMLVYLDNSQNGVGKGNENYARELLELHTLGVDGGYSQQDVQELARILTGLAFVPERRPAPRLKPEWESQYWRKNLAEFNPARHDYGDKTLLGQKISGSGWSEVEQALDLLCKHPATARFVSRKLALYFVGDDPPAALIDRLAAAFRRSDGDLRLVLQTLFASAEFHQSLGKKFKDPVHFALSSLRLAYDGRFISNPRPIVGALNQLGQGLYGHPTPDGYGLLERDWASSGQLAKRVELARQFSNGGGNLFEGDEVMGVSAAPPSFPMPGNRLFFTVIEPTLSTGVRQSLQQAASQVEWNQLLLSSPDWAYR